jgi:hypothetical protein
LFHGTEKKKLFLVYGMFLFLTDSLLMGDPAIEEQEVVAEHEDAFAGYGEKRSGLSYR